MSSSMYGLQDKLVASGGYRTTNIEVMTEDGYSLWLHRLGNNTGPPVLIQHGIMVGADSWVVGSPKKSLRKFYYD